MSNNIINLKRACPAKPWRSGGMTLIEIIVVVAIFGLIIAFGLTTDLSTIGRNNFRNEQMTLISVLNKARGRAMNNMFETTHGFCYVAPNYVLFRGRATCLPTSVNDELIKADTNIASNSGTTFPTEVVFAQLSGKTTTVTIHITDGIKSADININNEGTINW